MNRAWFAMLSVLVFASFANATALKSNVDTAYMYSDQQIPVYYWTVNTDYSPAYVSFTADMGQLNGYFSSPFVTAEMDGAKGSYLYISAPDCFRGAQTVHVRSQVCDYDGDCQTYEKHLTVQVTPAKSCRVMVNASYLPPQYYAPMPQSCAPCGACVSGCNSLSSGGCCNENVSVQMDNGYTQYSTITYSQFYDPTEYEVRVNGADSCQNILAGEWMRAPLSLMNYGAAGTFDLRLIGDKEKMNAILSNSYVSLVRNGISEVFIDVSPSRVQGGGRYWVTMQVLKNGVVTAEKDVCVDVEDVVQAAVSMPSFVTASACEDYSFTATVRNSGTSEQVFALLTGSFAAVSPSEVSLKPGESADVRVSISGQKLASGSYSLLKVGAATVEGVVRVVGEANTTVFAEGCASAASGVDASATEENDFFKVIVEVENPDSKPLQNVSVEIMNLPEGWSVLSESGFQVDANSKRNVTVWIKPSSAEEVSPLVVVKSDGRVVGTKEIPKLSAKAAGLTGFVTLALSQNGWIVAILVLVALLIIVLAGKRGGDAAPANGLDEIKASVEGPK